MKRLLRSIGARLRLGRIGRPLDEGGRGSVEDDLLERVGEREAPELAVDASAEGRGEEHHLTRISQVSHNVMTGQAQRAALERDALLANLTYGIACEAHARLGDRNAAGDGVVDAFVELG